MYGYMLARPVQRFDHTVRVSDQEITYEDRSFDQVLGYLRTLHLRGTSLNVSINL